MPDIQNTMTTEQFAREKNYGASMAVARAMLSKGIISERDYNKIDAVFRKKYMPVFGDLRAKSP